MSFSLNLFGVGNAKTFMCSRGSVPLKTIQEFRPYHIERAYKFLLTIEPYVYL